MSPSLSSSSWPRAGYFWEDRLEVVSQTQGQPPASGRPRVAAVDGGAAARVIDPGRGQAVRGQGFSLLSPQG